MMFGYDDGVEPQIRVVNEYYFEVTKDEPICFSILPFQFNENDKVDDCDFEKKVYLRGIADKGLYRLHKEVVSWRLGQFDYGQPKISVLSSEGNWIELLKPRKCYKDEVARSLLITIQMIHFVKKHHRNKRSLWDRLWDHLNEVFDELDPKPTMDDLRNHHSLIKLFLQRDSTLMKLKIMQRFNWDTTKTTEKPSMSATKVHLTNNDGSWTRNNDSGTDYDGYDDDDESNYDHSDDSDYDVYADSDYDVYDDSDYTDGNDNYNEYDTFDEGDNSDDDNDTLCALCDDGGKLISCIGQCKRSFHPIKKYGKESKCKTLGYTSRQLKEIGSFLCKNCEYKQHQCFKCGELEPSAEQNAKVFKCNDPSCGHFYHPKCVAKLQVDDSNGDGSSKLERRIMGGVPFTCPMHCCFKCGRMENKTQRATQFAICRRCPKSYHIECLPREISFETKDRDIKQRAWNLPGVVIIYCLDHKICRATGNAKRDHIKFPQTLKTIKVQDLAKKRGKMVSNRRRSVDQCSKFEHTQNSLQHLVLEPKGATMRLKENLQIEPFMVEATDHCMKEDLQVEPSMIGITNQSSQITLKWQKRKPRSTLYAGINTKKRKTSRSKEERYSRQSYNSAKKCIDHPIQIASILHPHLEPRVTESLSEDPTTYKDTELDKGTRKITGQDEGISMQDNQMSQSMCAQESVSAKKDTRTSGNTKSSGTKGGFSPYHVGDNPSEKLLQVPHVGSMVIRNTIHNQPQYARDKEQEVYGGHTFQDEPNSSQGNVTPKTMGIDNSSDKSEQSRGSRRRNNLTNDTTENSSNPLVGMNSYMEHRNHSTNGPMAYYGRYAQHHDVNYSSYGNYGPGSHAPLQPVLSPTEFDAIRSHDPYSYLREFQHDITRWQNPNFHPRSPEYFISGWHSYPYYPPRPMPVDYAHTANNIPIHGYDERNNFMGVGYNARGITPTAMYPPLQFNNNGAYQPHTHVRTQEHGATYDGHNREYGVGSHYTLSSGPDPQARRSVMDKYAPNLEQTNNQVRS